jgi:hypothetical protein
MRQHRLDLIVFFVFATLGCLFWALSVPGQRELAIRVWVLAIGALGLFALVAAVGAAAPRRHRSELAAALAARETAVPPVSQLAKIEREVTLSVGSAHDLHTRLLPQLREIAEARLERQGRQLSPETAGRWWELLRPDRPAPEDRFASGIRVDDLRALVADLERM